MTYVLFHDCSDWLVKPEWRPTWIILQLNWLHVIATRSKTKDMCTLETRDWSKQAIMFEN